LSDEYEPDPAADDDFALAMIEKYGLTKPAVRDEVHEPFLDHLPRAQPPEEDAADFDEQLIDHTFANRLLKPPRTAEPAHEETRRTSEGADTRFADRLLRQGDSRRKSQEREDK
jgi:hypothetical protein